MRISVVYWTIHSQLLELTKPVIDILIESNRASKIGEKAEKREEIVTLVKTGLDSIRLPLHRTKTKSKTETKHRVHQNALDSLLLAGLRKSGGLRLILLQDYRSPPEYSFHLNEAKMPKQRTESDQQRSWILEVGVYRSRRVKPVK